MSENVELVRTSKNYDGWDPSSIFGTDPSPAPDTARRPISSKKTKVISENDSNPDDSLIFVGSKIHADELKSALYGGAGNNNNVDNNVNQIADISILQANDNIPSCREKLASASSFDSPVEFVQEREYKDGAKIETSFRSSKPAIEPAEPDEPGNLEDSLNASEPMFGGVDQVEAVIEKDMENSKKMLRNRAESESSQVLKSASSNDDIISPNILPPKSIVIDRNNTSSPGISPKKLFEKEILTPMTAIVKLQSLFRGFKGRKIAEKLQLNVEREKRKIREQKRIHAKTILTNESVNVDNYQRGSMSRESLPTVLLDERISATTSSSHQRMLDGVNDDDDVGAHAGAGAGACDDTNDEIDDPEQIVIYKAQRKPNVESLQGLTSQTTATSIVMHVPHIGGDDEVENNNALLTPVSLSSARREKGTSSSGRNTTNNVIENDRSENTKKISTPTGPNSNSKLPVKVKKGSSSPKLVDPKQSTTSDPKPQRKVSDEPKYDHTHDFLDSLGDDDDDDDGDDHQRDLLQISSHSN